MCCRDSYKALEMLAKRAHRARALLFDSQSESHRTPRTPRELFAAMARVVEARIRIVVVRERIIKEVLAMIVWVLLQPIRLLLLVGVLCNGCRNQNDPKNQCDPECRIQEHRKQSQL